MRGLVVMMFRDEAPEKIHLSITVALSMHGGIHKQVVSNTCECVPDAINFLFCREKQ